LYHPKLRKKLITTQIDTIEHEKDRSIIATFNFMTPTSFLITNQTQKMIFCDFITRNTITNDLMLDEIVQKISNPEEIINPLHIYICRNSTLTFYLLNTEKVCLNINFGDLITDKNLYCMCKVQIEQNKTSKKLEFNLENRQNFNYYVSFLANS
jgi:hypothetical protein